MDYKREINPNTTKITGVLCVYRVEEIEGPLIQNSATLTKVLMSWLKGRL